MNKCQKDLIDDIISRIATEIWQEYKDSPEQILGSEMYAIQNYLGDFNINENGIEYPDGSKWSINGRNKN